MGSRDRTIRYKSNLLIYVKSNISPPEVNPSYSLDWFDSKLHWSIPWYVWTHPPVFPRTSIYLLGAGWTVMSVSDELPMKKRSQRGIQYGDQHQESLKINSCLITLWWKVENIYLLQVWNFYILCFKVFTHIGL